MLSQGKSRTGGVSFILFYLKVETDVFINSAKK